MTNSQPSVVCGLDGSEESASATEVARELATALDRRLVLAHVVPEPTSLLYRNTVARRRRWRAALRGGWVDMRGAAHHAETRVVLGDVADALREVCRDERAEFLVLGSRGRSGLAAAALGSVSAELAVSSECPVIIVPAGAAERFVRPSDPDGHILCGVDGSLRRRTCAAGRRADRAGAGPGTTPTSHRRGRSGRHAGHARCGGRRSADRDRLPGTPRTARGRTRLLRRAGRGDRAGPSPHRAPIGVAVRVDGGHRRIHLSRRLRRRDHRMRTRYRAWLARRAIASPPMHRVGAIRAPRLRWWPS